MSVGMRLSWKCMLLRWEEVTGGVMGVTCGEDV
jgi:hypothetical protein